MKTIFYLQVLKPHSPQIENINKKITDLLFGLLAKNLLVSRPNKSLNNYWNLSVDTFMTVLRDPDE